jgi:hypothetical protein
MPGTSSKIGPAVCCFVLGGAAVNALYHWGTPAHREAPAPAPGARAAQAFPDWHQTVARYGLREVPAGTVRTDRGRPLRVFVALRPGTDVAPLSDSPVVWQHLRMADLVRLAPPGGECNCHGWVFLGGRAWILGEDVEAVLRDNGYRPTEAPRPEDLVVYRDGGQVQHSGVVLGVAEAGQVLVESVWGDQGRYAHRALLPGYGRHQFYRSDRPGHRLCGWEDAPRAAASP